MVHSTGLSSSARPIIPKRGEKDYEPKAGSNLQQHLLERMRAAMFSALGGERTISRWASLFRAARIFLTFGWMSCCVVS